MLIKSLRIAQIDIEQTRISDFIDSKGTSIHYQVYEDAREHALDFANQALINLGFNNYLPSWLLRNLSISIAQQFYSPILSVLREVTMFKHLKRDRFSLLYLEVDKSIHWYFKRLNDDELSIKGKYFNKFKFLFEIIKFLAHIIMLIFKFYPLKTVNRLYDGKSILVSHYDEIHFRKDIRNKIHWFLDAAFTDFKLFCLVNSANEKRFNASGLKPPLNIEIIRNKFVGFRFYNVMRIYVEKVRELYLKKLLVLSDITRLKYMIKVNNIILQFLESAESNAHIVRSLNSRAFVYEDAYHFDSHIYNTLVNLLDFKTIQLQYSNLPFKSLLMLGNPSVLLGYSKYFEKKFMHDKWDLGPKEFKSAGYIFQDDLEKIKLRSSDLKRLLKSKGVNFIIGIFDENTQDDSDIWAHKSNSQHNKDIHQLCEFVLENSEIGIIFKYQFRRKSPQVLFPKDEILLAAIRTGRLLLPTAGNTFNRNLVLPVEVAFASDICIGELVGATASLEAAIAGTKSIFVDSLNIGLKYRKEYFENNLVFNNLNDALQEIKKLQEYARGYNGIGSWNSILDSMSLDKTFRKTSDLLFNLITK